jgi:UDP-glucose 4-epimerase
LHGQAPTIYGDGEQSRDFTYIDNVVDGNIAAMSAKKACGEVVNVACGGQITVNQVIAAINKALGTNVRPQYVDPRPGDVRHSCADVRLATTLLGYRPKVSFEDGLRRAIDYYRSIA